MNCNYLISNKGITIHGPLLIEVKSFEDNRGFFYESWNKKKFEKLINNNIDFKQDNHSRSSRGVLRGLHYQKGPNEQAKLVRCTSGEIFDVLVDLRVSSPTFASWASVKLSDQNKRQVWIPHGFAHGFLTISEIAEVQYKTSSYWSKEDEISIIYNDLNLNILWPYEMIKPLKIELSKKDLNGLTLNEVKNKGYLPS